MLNTMSLIFSRFNFHIADVCDDDCEEEESDGEEEPDEEGESEEDSGDDQDPEMENNNDVAAAATDEETTENDKTTKASMMKLVDDTGFDTLFPPLDGTGFFMTTCKINHSCDPNVFVRYAQHP